MQHHAGSWRSVIVALAVALATPSLGQGEELFQSAPGPKAPKPKPRPRVPQPPAAEPVAPGPAAVAAAPAVVAPAPAGVETVYSRHAPSGVAAVIIVERNWDSSNCTPHSVDIRVVEQARSGTTTVRDEMLTIPAKTTRSGDTLAACIGRPILGKRIYYQSNPRFRGTDRVGYLVSSNGGEWHRYEVQITVE